MSQETQIVPIVGRRLVLGFDGGCMVCSGLAERIKEQVGDKLELLSLHDPQVEQWRKNALGSEAPWAPTLIEVKGLKVNAWTGWKLGAKLSGFLGPLATWRIMQALGEMSAAPSIENSAIVNKLPGKAAEAVVGMSRGQFLKGVGGAAVAMSVLSATTLAPRAEALEDWQLPRFTKSRQLRGTRLRDYCNRIAKRADCGWVAGAAYATAMRSGLRVTSATDSMASRNGVRAMAAIHTTATGNELYICSFDIKGQKALTYYEWERPRKNIKTEVKRWGLGPQGDMMWVERATINGAHFTDPGAPSLKLQAQAACPAQCQNPLTGQHQVQTCSGASLACVPSLGTCAACAVTCLAPEPTQTTKYLCFICATTVCPFLFALNCCRQVCTVCAPCSITPAGP